MRSWLNRTKTLAIHPDKAVKFPRGKVITRRRRLPALTLGTHCAAEGCACKLPLTPHSRTEGAGLPLPTQVPDLPKPTPKLGIPRVRQDFRPCTYLRAGDCWALPSHRAAAGPLSVRAHAWKGHPKSCAGTDGARPQNGPTVPPAGKNKNCSRCLAARSTVTPDKVGSGGLQLSYQLPLLTWKEVMKGHF